MSTLQALAGTRYHSSAPWVLWLLPMLQGSFAITGPPPAGQEASPSSLSLELCSPPTPKLASSSPRPYSLTCLRALNPCLPVPGLGIDCPLQPYTGIDGLMSSLD